MKVVRFATWPGTASSRRRAASTCADRLGDGPHARRRPQGHARHSRPAGPGVDAPPLPGVSIVTQQGVKLDPAERYMDNVADPTTAASVHRLAERRSAMPSTGPLCRGLQQRGGQRHGCPTRRPTGSALHRLAEQKYRSLDASTPPGPRSAGHAASMPGTKSACPSSTAPALRALPGHVAILVRRHHRRAA